MSLKRQGEWKSKTVAQEYFDQSLKNKNQTAYKILRSIKNLTNGPSTSETEIFENSENSTIQQQLSNSLRVTFNNSSNFSINSVDVLVLVVYSQYEKLQLENCLSGKKKQSS